MIPLKIERTYNRRRRERVLGRLTPIEFEAIITSPDLAAAAATATATATA